MTGSIRLHIPSGGAGPRAAGDRVTLPAAQAHYLGRVMRRGPGDRVLLFDGVSGEFEATLATLDRAGAVAVLGPRTRPQRPGPDLWLLFALLKRDATDLVVRQATEMGVAELHPLLTAHAVAGRTNPERLAAIATEAAEQSERLTVPRLHPPRTLDQALAAWPADRTLFTAIERARAASGPTPGGPAGGPSAVLIGPEGGFSAAEVTALRRHPAVRLLSLGPRILRAETAAVAALARVTQHSIEAP